MDFYKNIRELIDLNTVFRRSGKNTGGELSLSRLTESTLGYQIKKDRHCTDWTARPLCKHQIYYAALDAYCLLLIHDKLNGKDVEIKQTLDDAQ